MNFIAHLFLSGNEEPLLVGNFIADSIKGKDIREFSLQIQRGVYFHRYIDQFTDAHPLVKKAKKLLFGKYSHYSSVLVDIFFDYYLVNHWKLFSAESLHDFCLRTTASYKNITLYYPFGRNGF